MKAVHTAFSSTLVSLGKFELWIADRLMPSVPTQKARAILAYLIANRGHDIARERLLELFWNDVELERAREGLRTALSSIRRALREVHDDPDELLYTDKSVVRWIATTDYDADRFVTLANSEEPSAKREALQMYGGDFLEGNYDEWVSSERERLAGIYENALAGIVQFTRDPADARLLLERNPYDETAYAVLIETEARAKRPAAAKELLAKYRAAMSEVGTKPSPVLEQKLLEAADETVRTESNVPTPLSSFIGRAHEIAEVEALLKRSRLITIVGAGGMGKTRLALAVAEQVAPAFVDGESFIDLAAIADPAYIDSSIAAAVLGTLPASDRAPFDILVSTIANRRMLLVVDNCEHLMPAIVRTLDMILRKCSRVVILATSREPLRIEGEDVLRLSALPDADAITLFAERAHACDQKFEVNDHNEADVAHICRRVDGIPLAIELAASRVNVLSIRHLRTKLDEQFRFLAAAGSTALPRHKTVRALIDWSYDLLDSTEQKLLRSVAVFIGGFTLESATAVFNEGATEIDTLELLSSLVAKSLVVFEPVPDVERYRLLQTTEEYALEKMLERGEFTSARERHMQYFLHFAREADTNYGAWNARKWLFRYPPEMDNVRSAIDYCFERNDAVHAAGLIAAAREVYLELGLHAEGIHRAERALDALDENAPLELRAGLWLVIAQLGNTLYQTAQALSNALRARDAFERLNDKYHLAFSSQTLGFALMRSGAHSDAEEYFSRAQLLAEECGNRHVVLRTLLRRAENRRKFMAPAEWLPLYERALQLARALDDELYTGYVLGYMAEVSFSLGDPSVAITRGHAARRIFQERKDTAKESNALANLAGYHVAIDDLESAKRYAKDAILLGRKAENFLNAIYAALHLAAVAALEGNTSDGARLIGFACAAHERHGGSFQYTENYVRDKAIEVLRERLDARDFASLEKDGAALNDDEGFELALQIAAPPPVAGTSQNFTT